MNLLRENKIDEARPHLELAYRGDPFSAPIVNTLRLIDSFDNFVVSAASGEAGACRGLERAASNPGAFLRLHKDEAAVLEPYVLDLVNRTIETYSKRYGFKLKEPVIVELYPDHDDFAVRIAGLPGIGLLGVTFGYLVAMDSPTGRADDTSIGARRCGTRWRTCSRSKRRTTSCRAGSAKASPSTRSGARGRCRAGTFRCPCSRPSRRTSSCRWPSSIAASSARRTRRRSSCRTCRPGSSASTSRAAYGQEALARMLEEFGDGKDTAQAIQAALGISPGQFDEEFAAYVDNGARQRSSPTSSSWQEKQAEVAARPSRRRIGGSSSRRPPRRSSSSPTTSTRAARTSPRRARHRELDETALLTNTLLEYRRRGGYDPDALIALARALGEADRNDDAIDVFEDVLMVAPLRAEVHRDFGDRLAAANRPREALVEYQALLAMNPQDLADAHYRLAKTYVAVEDRAKGREHLLYALEIAPHYREAQQLLLEVVR